MVESAALLVDEVLPREPIRQWVLSFPFQLRFLFASRPAIMGKVLGIVYRTIATHLLRKPSIQLKMLLPSGSGRASVGPEVRIGWKWKKNRRIHQMMAREFSKISQ